MNTKAEKLDRQIKAYLLSVIDSDGFENEPYFNECLTDKDKIRFLRGRFVSEYQWHINRSGKLKAALDWMQGLALNVEYMNHSIVEMIKEWQGIKHDLTDDQYMDIVDGYWSSLSVALVALITDGYKD